MKRLLTGLVSLVFCFGAFAGCSYRLSGDSESGGDSALVGEIDFNAGYDYADTLKIWVSNVDTEKEIINAFVGAFKEVYPNITAEVEGVDSLDDQLVFNAGLDSMCDIFWVTPEDIALYRDYDIIAPLTPIIEQDPSFDIENLNENSVRSCTDDGTLYVMPRDYNQVVMYYNVDMFDAAGVEYPSSTEAMSQEEFVQMLADLKEGLLASDETNSYGQAYKDCFTNSMDAAILWDSLSWPIVKSFGGTIFDEEGNYLDEEGNMLFDSEETYQAMRFAHDLVADGYMGDPGTWSTRDGTQFLMETAPVYLHCRAKLTSITTSTNTFHGLANVGVAPCPDFGDDDTYYVDSGATGYAMYSGSKHKTAAWLFLKFLVSERAQEEASESGNLVPVVESLIDDETAVWRRYTTDAFGEQYSNDPFVYRRDECFTHVREFMQYVTPEYQGSMLDRLQNCYTDSIANVRSDPDTEIRGFISKWAAQMRNYIEAGGNS